LKSVRFLLFIGALAALAFGCPAETPKNAGNQPDPDKITIFYPLGDKVRGRGLAGAVKPGTKFLYVSAHPSAGSAVVRPEPDGSFEFAVLAGSKDVIEFAYAQTAEGEMRGPSIYLEAPIARVFREDMFCCKAPGASTGKCIDPSEEEPVCTNHTPFDRCDSNANCAKLSERNLDFPALGLNVSSPNENKTSRIFAEPNFFPPLSVISVENRGQQGVGGRVGQKGKHYRVADEQGVFEFKIFANGDDELVFEIYQLDGQRSRQHSVLVPDADFAGVDIVGAFPGYDILTPGKTGQVAIRFSPYGIDGKGICPNPAQNRPPEDPVLCFTGGLEYSMISIDRILLDQNEVTATRTATSTQLPFTRATVGDIMAGVQYINILLDVGASSFSSDPEGTRFQAAIDVVHSMRSRDRLALYSIGKDDNGYALEVDFTNERNLLIDRIKQLQTKVPMQEHAHHVFAAIEAAADGLQANSKEIERGLIILINTESPIGTREDFEKALTSVAPNPGFSGYPTLVVGLDLRNKFNGANLQDLAIFSGGSFLDAFEPRTMLTKTAQIIGTISGAYVLLYDVNIPQNVGKAAAVEIEATLNFPAGTERQIQSQTTLYQGTIEVSGAP